MSTVSSDNLTPLSAAEQRVRIRARRRHTRRADSGNALRRYQAELRWCLAHAERLLGGPARPIVFDWDLQRTLQPALVPEGAFGLGREPPIMLVDRSRRGRSLHVGTGLFRWQDEDCVFRMVWVTVPYGATQLSDFWAVRVDEFAEVTRRLRRRANRATAVRPPVLAAGMLSVLWRNTIGFLTGNQELLTRYGVAPKRGVLLLGEPGNGKTLACRWLATQCRRRGLEWKSVTVPMYEAAKSEQTVPTLFHLDAPGIVLFDDFDGPLRDRRASGTEADQATFLAELDGVESRGGVVYLFTSNAKLSDLDPAMRRPGRIDVVLQLEKPNARLRRRLVTRRWHGDILGGIDAMRLVADTEGFSFAELEEARKLLVMHRAETGVWDWPAVQRLLRNPYRERAISRPIGFVPCAANGDDPL